MRRRRFLSSTGASVLGATGLNSVNHQPTVGVSFDVVGVESTVSTEVNSIIVDFDTLKFQPNYIKSDEEAELSMKVVIEENKVGGTQTSIPINEGLVTKSDLDGSVPIVCEGIPSGNDINGFVEMRISHVDVNDTYRQEFTIKTINYSIPEDVLDDTSESGVYTLKPSSSIDSFDIYCNMDEFGGGWGLVGKSWGGDGSSNTTLDLNQDEYLNRIMNVNGYNESGLKSDAEVSGVDNGFAFLSRAKMNALFEAGARMFRVEYKGGNRFDNSSYSRQAFITPNNVTDFDAWHSIRDTRVFGESGTCDSNYVNGLGTDYDAGTEAEYNADKNKITNPDTLNCGIGHWDDGYSYERSDGNTYSVSRHGISGDIESGFEWLFVISPDDRRHPHGVEYDYARVWVR